MEKGISGTPGAAIVVPFTNRRPGAPCGPRPPSFFHWRDFKDWVVGMVGKFIVDLTTKADKVSGGTIGNLVGIGADGNIVDSGLRAEGLRPLTFDTTPTAGSLNPVTSGGIKQAIEDAKPSGYEQVKVQVSQNAEDIDAIEGKIPSQASAQNQLADKAFVNSSIATNTATFRGTFNLVTDLQLPLDATHEQVAVAVKAKLGQADYDGSDYVYVQTPQDLEHTDAMKLVDRYKCVETGADSVVKNWEYEWTLNNSSFTAAQWAAINSGITSALVAKLGALPTAEQLAAALLAKYEKPSTGIPKTDLSAGVQASLDKADTALQSVEEASGAVNLAKEDDVYALLKAVAEHLGYAVAE